MKRRQIKSSNNSTHKLWFANWMKYKWLKRFVDDAFDDLAMGKWFGVYLFVSNLIMAMLVSKKAPIWTWLGLYSMDFASPETTTSSYSCNRPSPFISSLVVVMVSSLYSIILRSHQIAGIAKKRREEKKETTTANTQNTQCLNDDS